jgi:hypothetical protein
VESTLNVPQLDDGSRVEIIGTASTNCGGKLDKLVADLDHVRVLSSGATGYVFDDHLKTQ